MTTAIIMFGKQGILVRHQRVAFALHYILVSI